MSDNKSLDISPEFVGKLINVILFGKLNNKQKYTSAHF